MDNQSFEIALNRVELLMTRGFEQIYMDHEVLMFERIRGESFVGVIVSQQRDPIVESWEKDPFNPSDLEWEDLERELKQERPFATVTYRGYDPMTGAPVVGLQIFDA